MQLRERIHPPVSTYQQKGGRKSNREWAAEYKYHICFCSWIWRKMQSVSPVTNNGVLYLDKHIYQILVVSGLMVTHMIASLLQCWCISHWKQAHLHVSAHKSSIFILFVSWNQPVWVAWNMQYVPTSVMSEYTMFLNLFKSHSLCLYL